MRSLTVPERSAFPPIADYALLSDCEVAALVAPSGNIEWLCLPQFGSPSVFSSMLDRGAGRFRFGPAAAQVPTARRYLPGSMVVETTWKVRTGWLVVRDALTVGPWHHTTERAHRQRRAPNDWEADHTLVRTARCAQGMVELQLDCEPRFDYGRLAAQWEYDGPGYHDAKATAPGSDLTLRFVTDLNVGFEGPRLTGRTTLREGEAAFVTLGWSEHPCPTTFHEAFERVNATSEYWREWLSHGDFPDHPWRSYLERSALTLKGLQYAPTGGFVAAPTTSLPREPGGERNWDYRFSFVRDSSFILRGAYSLGFDWEADDFLYFLTDLAAERSNGELQNIYSVSGGKDLTEERLDHLSGYLGARPVRIGNDSYSVEQHDVWGEIIDAVYIHAKTRDKLPERVWPLVKKQVELAAERWRQPDRGIWALRGDPQHYVSSKVMCWVALDRGAMLADLRDETELAERWRGVGQEIKHDVLDKGLDERGVFTQHYGTSALDASALLIPLVKFLPPSDHRVRKTVLAIQDELVEGGLVLRHRPDDPSFAVEGEAFAVCSFWLVAALDEIGEKDASRELCERLLAYSSDLGLYAEHLDPNTGRHLGNFPHAFTHLALVNALFHVIAAEGGPGLPISAATQVRAGA
jgi:GH15 family glucan-1,4-alpha-glucosidase